MTSLSYSSHVSPCLLFSHALSFLLICLLKFELQLVRTRACWEALCEGAAYGEHLDIIQGHERRRLTGMNLPLLSFPFLSFPSLFPPPSLLPPPSSFLLPPSSFLLPPFSFLLSFLLSSPLIFSLDIHERRREEEVDN